jgi:hypothetical protein
LDRVGSGAKGALRQRAGKGIRLGGDEGAVRQILAEEKKTNEHLSGIVGTINDLLDAVVKLDSSIRASDKPDRD